MAKKTQAVFTQEQEAAPIQDPLVNGDTLGAHNILRLWDGQSWDISLKSYSALADISPHPSPAEWAMLGLLPARPGPGSIAAVPGLLRTKCPPWCRQPTICIQMRGESLRALASRGTEAMAWAKRRGWPASSPQNLQAWGARWPDKGHQPGCPHRPCSGVRDVPRPAAPSCPVCLPLLPFLMLLLFLLSPSLSACSPAFPLPAGVLEELG